MSGYRQGYSEHHSPTWRIGVQDGMADTDRIGSCPPIPPVGVQSEGAMYLRGYRTGFNPAAFHPGCKNCQERAS